MDTRTRGGLLTRLGFRMCVTAMLGLVLFMFLSCADKTGKTASSSGVSKEPVYIACWTAKSGYHIKLGKDTIRGIEMAIDDFGGTIKGHPIELISFDSQCTPDGGAYAARKIVKNPKIKAAIGPSCTSAALRGVPILWDRGIPTISPTNSSPLMTAPSRGTGYDGYLRTFFNDKYQGIVAAEFAYQKLGVKSVATIIDGSNYASFLADLFAEEFKKLGGTVVVQEEIKPGSQSMKPVLTRIAADQPGLLYYPVFTKETAYLTRQIRSMDAFQDTYLMSSDGSFTKRVLSIAGKKSIGMYFTSPDFSEFKTMHADFLSKYKKKYGQGPKTIFYAYSHDAAKILLAAMDRVSETGPGNTLMIDSEKLNLALHQTSNQKGLTGSLNCDQYGDCGSPRIGVFKIESSHVRKKQLPSESYWKPF